jgi:hypothetical protein
MANKEHLELLRRGIDVWNQWRKEHPDVRPDFSGESLGVDYLALANLEGANLRGTEFAATWMNSTILRGADLSGANISESDFIGVDLSYAQLDGTDLSYTSFIGTNVEGARISNCYIYGISVWDLKGEPAEQSNLAIMQQPRITVDKIEVAQFIYLLLNNQSLRDVIDTVTSKVVLILGRFTPERKAVLNAIQDELRKQNYLPILFDFDVPENRDITETVTLLARMSKFIIADLTDPSSIPKELEAIVPTLAVPVQPLIQGQARPYSMFRDYWKYDWVLEVYRYNDTRELLASLDKKVIAPAIIKLNEIEERRNRRSAV